MGNPISTGIVAIVDDDEAIRTALGRLVRTIGYKPRTFGSGEQLLACVADLRPACVLTDIQMPGMTGIAHRKDRCTLRQLIDAARQRGHAQQHFRKPG